MSCIYQIGSFTVCVMCKFLYFHLFKIHFSLLHNNALRKYLWGNDMKRKNI